MTSTEGNEQPGRCVPFLRPHRWGRWVPVEVETASIFKSLNGAETRQGRECRRCGRRQIDTLRR